MSHRLRLLGRVLAVAVLVSGCASDSPPSAGALGDEASSSSSPGTTIVVNVESSTSLATTTSQSTTSVPATTTTIDASAKELEADIDLIMDLYAGWSRAVAAGQTEIEAYLNAHMYQGLPRCGAGEKTLTPYTADRESIKRSDDWHITWGVLNGVQPDGRVFEVQLAELETVSHVTILHGVAYVFWNCRGLAPPPNLYKVELVVDEWGQTHAGGYWILPGEYLGSGCSPGTDHLPDGVWFGRITAATADRVEFDMYCMAHPDETSDGQMRILNSSSKIRTARIGASAQVFAVTSEGDRAPQPYSSWYQAPHPEMFCGPEGCWEVWLFVNGGHVTEIIQEWFP